jgi:ubiquitin-like protein 4
MPHPMRKSDPSTSISNPGSTPSLTIHLKSLRNPPLSLSLSFQSPTTSIFELKTAVAKHIGREGVETIRVLYKKKPCSDSKTVKEVVGGEFNGGEVEFSVMVIGGATVGASQEQQSARAGIESGSAHPPVAQGPTGDAVLATDEFWLDLRGYLIQRLRDEEKAEDVSRAFREDWTRRTREG